MAPDALPPQAPTRPLRGPARTAAPITTSTERCRACGAPGIVLLDVMTAADEPATQMRSCSRCEARSWWRGDEELPMEEVLGRMSRVPSRPRRTR